MNCGDPTGQITKADTLEAGRFDQPGKRFLGRKATNAFDEVRVGLRSTGCELAKLRDHIERVEVVDGIQDRYVNVAELKAQKPATGFQDTPGFSQCAINVRYVADTKRDCVGIERAVSERKLLGVTLHNVDAITEVCGADFTAANFEHLGTDIA